MIVKELLKVNPVDQLNRKSKSAISFKTTKKLGNRSTLPDQQFNHLTNVIIDLGAGSGRVIFEAAKKTNDIKFIAVEIHPTLILYMRLRRLFHPNRHNIKILRKDIFNLDLNSLTTDNFQPTTIYLYVDRHSLSRLTPNLLKLPKGSSILTYMYHLPEKVTPTHVHQGKHKLYEYVI